MSQGTKAVLDDLKHAGEFTKIENTAIVYVLRGWFGSLSAIPGALEAGDDAWAFTTLQEHFDSKLNPDPTKRTPEKEMLAMAITEMSATNLVVITQSVEKRSDCSQWLCDEAAM